MTYPYCKNTRIRRQTAYDLASSDQTDKHPKKTIIALHKNSDSDALTFRIDSCMILLYFHASRKFSNRSNCSKSVK